MGAESLIKKKKDAGILYLFMHLTLARFSIAAAVSMSSRGTKRTLPTMSAATDFIENINVEYERLHKSFEMQFWCAAT